MMDGDGFPIEGNCFVRADPAWEWCQIDRSGVWGCRIEREAAWRGECPIKPRRIVGTRLDNKLRARLLA